MKDTQMLQSRAYDHLIGLIKDGKLKEGEYYSLNKMAKESDVSRTPFRDAVLCRLWSEAVPGQSQGLVS